MASVQISPSSGDTLHLPGDAAPAPPDVGAAAGASGASASPRGDKDRRVVEYYAEERFKGVDLSRHVHVGWGVVTGAAAICVCMGISAATQGRSWNVSFLWLQRRVGAQFATLSYMVTDNLFHYHDGDKWVHRDWTSMLSRYKKDGKELRGGTLGTFASSPVQ